MVNKKKKIKIAFDLDGVIIDKPPLVPQPIIEWLFRGNCQKKLHYRFPKTRIEQIIRRLSHYYLIRPPIKKNLEFIKELSRNKDVKLYIVSSRYSFLREHTREWLKRYLPKNHFVGIYLNLGNLQPHFFKEKVLREIKPEIFIDDDVLSIQYLQNKQLPIKFFCYSIIKTNNKEIKFIQNLKEIFN